MEHKKVIQFCAIPVNAIKIKLIVKKKSIKSLLITKKLMPSFFSSTVQIKLQNIKIYHFSTLPLYSSFSLHFSHNLHFFLFSLPAVMGLKGKFV